MEDDWNYGQRANWYRYKIRISAIWSKNNKKPENEDTAKRIQKQLTTKISDRNILDYLKEVVYNLSHRVFDFIILYIFLILIMNFIITQYNKVSTYFCYFYVAAIFLSLFLFHYLVVIPKTII